MAKATVIVVVLTMPDELPISMVPARVDVAPAIVTQTGAGVLTAPATARMVEIALPALMAAVEIGATGISISARVVATVAIVTAVGRNGAAATSARAITATGPAAGETVSGSTWPTTFVTIGVTAIGKITTMCRSMAIGGSITVTIVITITTTGDTAGGIIGAGTHRSTINHITGGTGARHRGSAHGSPSIGLPRTTGITAPANTFTATTT